MKPQICPNCGKNHPRNKYCAFCGEKMNNFIICISCKVQVPSDLSVCPYCSAPIRERSVVYQVKSAPWYKKYLQPLKSSLLIVFFLSSYSIFQIFFGTFLLILIPQTDIFDPLLSLLIIGLSNLVFIFILIKYSPFKSKYENKYQENTKAIIAVGLLFLFSIAFFEFSLSIIDNFLDSLSIPPIQSSPYDDYFSSPNSALIFALLAIIIAPVFEEIMFRRHIISFLEYEGSSKLVLVSISGIIFSLHHLPADLINGSLRYTIEHLYVVLLLGIILGVIYLRFGLFYSICLHSLWNFLSFVIQFGVESPEFIFLYDLLVLIGIILIVILFLFSLYYYRNNIFTKWKMIRRDYKLKPLSMSLLVNISIVIVYELLMVFLLFGFVIQILGIFLGALVLNLEQKNNVDV